MILNLSDFILKDFIYRQNPDGTYIVENCAFQKEDKNSVVDSILTVLRSIYEGIVKENNVNPGKPLCNEFALAQALARYSRDVFGEARLMARIQCLKDTGRMTNEQHKQLCSFSDYGLKIDSCAPYVHRQASNLIYWLSVLKPFSLKANHDNDVVKLGLVFDFHNEYIAYCLILAMLKPLDVTLNIHKNSSLFSDLLYDLHFRCLSRSSLEFFLGAHLLEVSQSA
jgi:hypothetical protein